jgi:ppGpp synthetase/RelA/SpoT-type nucleotidyltranferase
MDFMVFFYSFLKVSTTPKGLRKAVDTVDVASQTFFDLKGMLVELEQLELREREVSALRHELHETLDSRPNEFVARREKEVSKERRQLHRRIDILRTELRRLNRRPA